MEIETDKTTVGVPTPLSGTIEEIFVQDGDTVKAGQDLFKIKPGEVGDAPKAAAPAAETPKPAAAAPPPPAQGAPKQSAAPVTPPYPPPPRVSTSLKFGSHHNFWIHFLSIEMNVNQNHDGNLS